MFESNQYSFHEVSEKLAEIEVTIVEDFFQNSIQEINSVSDQNKLVHLVITFKKQTTRKHKIVVSRFLNDDVLS